MISRYANYSSIKKVYVPEILDEYDAEVYNALYYLSRRLGFELLNYRDTLLMGDVRITRGIFEYNRMLHFSVDINFARTNILYLGIGYESGFRQHMPEIFDTGYDIVFYGSHKHNFRDDNYVAGIHAGFAGVLSQYITRGTREPDSYNMTHEILQKYLEHGSLFYSSGDDYSHIVFNVRRNGNITHYFK
jgi:hypothetical protein